MCVESGVMHLASLLGTPVVGLFAGADPALWQPLGTRARFLRALEGGRCFRANQCPMPACLNAVSPADVLRACGELLA